MCVCVWGGDIGVFFKKSLGGGVTLVQNEGVSNKKNGWWDLDYFTWSARPPPPPTCPPQHTVASLTH